jgi:alpha-maltose-1-phosphate synthase
MIGISHPFGNPNSYNAALAFQECDSLDVFWTSIFAPLGLPRRRHISLRRELVRTWPVPEMLRLATTLLPPGPWNGRHPSRVDGAWQLFDGHVAGCLNREITAVYAYEDGAHHTFRRARQLGMRTIYELPIAYFEAGRSILEREAQRHPELAKWMPVLNEPEEKLARKRSELDSADIVVTASTFVKNSIPHNRVRVPIVTVPYGCETSTRPKTWSARRGPLKLIYAGMLDPRKGIHYLFHALSQLDPTRFELTLAGRWNPQFREWLDAKYRVPYRDAGQVLHAKLLEMYKDHDLFVFPTLHEGFGLVLTEAMAAGIPIASTERSGAPDIIEDGVQGFLFRAGSEESLLGTLQRALEMQDCLPEMGARARARAETLTWAHYRKSLIESLTPYLGSN